MITPAPKPPVSERKPRKPLQSKARLKAKTPLAKVNKARLDKRTKKYRAYMSSAAWKAKRAARMMRDRWTCQECGYRYLAPGWGGDVVNYRQLHVDHLTYARFGNENMEDLETLCSACHRQKHAMSALRPRFLRAG